MKHEDVLLTPEGMELLQNGLKSLTNEEMPDLLRRLAEARAHGDLSENAEYSAVKERKAHTQARIDELKLILTQATVHVPSADANGRCVFGAYVHIQLSNNGRVSKREYQLVSVHESDTAKGKLSIQSPLGQGLLGKSSGEIVEIEAPAGTITYEIISVSYPA